MSYKDHFRFGSGEGQRQLWVYFSNPQSMHDLAYIQRLDRHAEEDIKTLESVLADLKEYRQDLSRRYSELAATTFSYRLYLVRDKSWSTKKVSYTVRIVRVFPDGTEIDELKEVFSGADRKKAFDRFSELKKSRPGIEAIQDTQKKRWET